MPQYLSLFIISPFFCCTNFRCCLIINHNHHRISSQRSHYNNTMGNGIGKMQSHLSHEKNVVYLLELLGFRCGVRNIFHTYLALVGWSRIDNCKKINNVRELAMFRWRRVRRSIRITPPRNERNLFLFHGRRNTNTIGERRKQQQAPPHLSSHHVHPHS